MRDAARGVRSNEALLVSLAAPRLRGLGFSVARLGGVTGFYEHALYEALESQMPRGAHAAYNALIGRIVSFAETYGQSQRRL